MKERPILFSGPMVRAILDGRKTQTRRVIKPQPSGGWLKGTPIVYRETRNDPAFYALRTAKGITKSDLKCPYGMGGDRLWVRESFWRAEVEGHGIGNQFIVYEEEMKKQPEPKELRPVRSLGAWGHRPSIHMPRWASRINLEIIETKVERLQDITEGDARDEGMEYRNDTRGWHSGTELPIGVCPSAHEAFRLTWNVINHGRGFGWDVNPWVWVVSFRRIK